MFKKSLFIFTLTYLSLFPMVKTHAQGNIDIDTDLVSNYVWRGQLLSPAFNIQPAVTFTNSHQYFSAGLWGSYGVGDFYSEINIFASLYLGPLSLTITDYFVYPESYDLPFFDYRKQSTGHTLEFIAEMMVSEDIPLTLTWGTFFFGEDYNESGDRMHSSYFEATYSTKYNNLPLEFFAGLTPWKSFYAEKLYPVNIGFSTGKNIEVSDTFTIPVTGTFCINPWEEKALLVLILSF